MEQHVHSPSYYYYFPVSDSAINILYYYHILHSKLDIYILFYFYHMSISGTSQHCYLWKPADDICPSRSRFSEVPLYWQSWTSWRLCQRYICFLYYSNGSLPCSARIPDQYTRRVRAGLPTCFPLIKWRKSTL